MTKQQTEQAQAITTLREHLKPGDTVYTSVTHVARSGMSRSIRLFIIRDGAPWDISYFAARAMSDKIDQKNGGIRIGGCGMDMGFSLVYNLSRALFRDTGFACIGDKCPSNDHNNAYYREREHQCVVCNKPVNGAEWSRRLNEHRAYAVCSRECVDGVWMHSDHGYALIQRWL